MVCTFLPVQFVFRQGAPSSLQPLLQSCFRVLEILSAGQAFYQRVKKSQDDFTAGIVSAVKKYGSQNRFERVCEDRGTSETPGLQLTFTEMKMFAQVQSRGDIGQAETTHQARPHPAQVAFLCIRTMFKESRRDHQVKNTVAEEFESLIIPGTLAPVRQCSL